MNGAVVVAAGRGTRLGTGAPKCLRILAGKPLLLYSLETLASCPDVAAVIVVVPPAHVDDLAQKLQAAQLTNLTAIVPGGDSRAESVLQGLDSLPEDVELVAVHDAARPFATVELFAEVFRAAEQCGGAIAAAPVTDTLKRADLGRITQTLDRTTVWQAQTPQVFARSLLAAAIRSDIDRQAEITDEAQAMENAGHPVHIVSNTDLNLKISTPADWRFAEFLLGRKD
jgi:2-C-methyl-D-erythritol 4-phosphate cytidylyltransferase